MRCLASGVLALILASPGHARTLAYRVRGVDTFSGIAVGGPLLLVADMRKHRSGVVSAYDGRTGVLRWTVQDPEPDDEDIFGFAVAASERWSAVASRSGVHVFDAEGSFVRTVSAPGGVYDQDLFGDRLAVDGDWLVVRQRLAYGPSPYENHAVVHLYDVPTGLLRWTFSEQTLFARDLFRAGDFDFGDSLSVSGDRIYVSAPSGGVVCALDIPTGTDIWCARSPSRWGGDRFGHALAAYGNALLVGAPGGHRLEFGNAYLLDARSGAVRRKFHGTGRGSRFGASVAIQRTRLLVGAPGGLGSKLGGRTYLIGRSSGRVLETFGRTLALAFVGSRIALAEPRAPDAVVRVFK